MRALAILLLAGCYSPSTPSGAYRCSTADSACPKHQQCVCGLCVNRDEDAACSFSVDATAMPKVEEHQSFPVTIRALQKDGNTASGFRNSVTLGFVLPDGFSWCDVTPSTVELKDGTATVQVKLNRETIPPQKPKLRASFADNVGESAGIQVTVPPFVKDLTPVVAPATPLKPFGWANTVVTEPAVVHDAGGFRMYFTGYRLGNPVALGVATSPDGRTFTPTAEPILKPAASTWYSGEVRGPAPFFTKDGVSMIFTGTEAILDLTPPGQLGVAHSSDGLSPFTVMGTQPVVKNGVNMQTADCDYCTDSIDYANVLNDPAQTSGGKLMFFSASSQAKIAAIGRASSTDDGATWTVEPAPVLSGDIGGEAILLAPHVLRDGSVYKMWYSFALLGEVLQNPASMCDIHIYGAYATSSDGFYWVRSPSNLRQPALSVGDNGWDAGVIGFIAGSAIASDGTDPANGISLYYTTLRHVDENDPTSQCISNGIGRATRP